MSRRVAVRGRWYWFNLSLRNGFVEFGRRRLVWRIFTVDNDPPPTKPARLASPSPSPTEDPA